MSRLLVLTTSWPRSPGDTAGSFVLHWARSLAQLGHSLLVLCPASKGAPSSERYDDNLEVRRIETTAGENLFYRAGAPENLASDWKARVAVPFFVGGMLRAAMQAAARVDLIVGHWAIPMGAITALVGKSHGIPAASVSHSGDVHLLQTRLRVAAPILRRLFSSTRVACVSAHQTDSLRHTLGEPTVLPMGVEESFFASPPKRISNPIKKIFGMGRLVPIKGFDLLLRAAAGLPVSIQIAGEGPERGRLETLAKELRVDCTLVGQLSGQARLDAFAEADLFVLPSRVLPDQRSEGLPVSLLEAAAANTPLLTSTSGGAQLFFQDDAAFFPANDLDALRGALQECLLDGDALQARAARARARVEPLRWSNVGRAYEEFFGLSNR